METECSLPWSQKQITCSNVTEKSISRTYPCPVRESNKLHQCYSERKSCVSSMRDHTDRRSLLNLLNEKKKNLSMPWHYHTAANRPEKPTQDVYITVPPLSVHVTRRNHIFWHSVVEIVALKFPIYKWNAFFPFIFMLSLLAASF